MIYVLHFARPLRHARHYVGFTADLDVERRVAEHLEQRGRRPSRIVAAALRAGIAVTLAGTLDGDRETERRLKDRHNAASFCPTCRQEYNAAARVRMRAIRAAKKVAPAAETRRPV